MAQSGASRWCVTTANGHVVRGPYLNREQAEGALEQIRERERQQSKEEDDHGYAEHLREAREVEAWQERKHEDDEPPGAGSDPRPDPRTHPEFWTE